MILMPSNHVQETLDAIRRAAPPLKYLLDKYPDDRSALEEVIDRLVDLKALILAAQSATQMTLAFFPKEVRDALAKFDRPAG